MIVEPAQVFKAIPTAESSHVAPISSLALDKPEYQHVHYDGKAAFWVVFVLMVLSSAAFAGWAYRVPLVRWTTCAHIAFVATNGLLSPSVCSMSSRP